MSALDDSQCLEELGLTSFELHPCKLDFSKVADTPMPETSMPTPESPQKIPHEDALEAHARSPEKITADLQAWQDTEVDSPEGSISRCTEYYGHGDSPGLANASGNDAGSVPSGKETRLN